MKRFIHQVAGHDHLLSNDEQPDLVYKPCVDDVELAFYESLIKFQPPLLKHVPAYVGSIEMQGKKWIQLENLVHAYERPCVLDLKLGTRLYDDRADAAKRDKMQKLVESTSSKQCGIRITGIQVYENNEVKKLDKNWGKSLTVETLPKALKQFIPSELKAKIRDSVEILRNDLIETLKVYRVKLYSCSLLICFDAALKDYQVKLIDFCHASICIRNEDSNLTDLTDLMSDDGVLFGLCSLLKMIEN